MSMRRFAANLGLVVLLLSARTAGAVEIQLERPGEREFILDRAGLITPEDQAKIRALAEEALKKKAAPIIVVTIDSMSNHGGAGMRIETFARLLFDQWGIGHEKLGEATWNKGMLLLVSRADRKARIELGAGWGRDFDDEAAELMEEHIIPRFREGDYSAGIVAGVEGLSRLAQGLELPTRPRPWWHWALLIGAVVLFIFTIVSLIRRGASGWAWLFWGALFAFIGYMLYQMYRSQQNSGGSFSGGSFGGGFSGGGGATGSW